MNGEYNVKRKAVGFVVGGLIFLVGIPFVLVMISWYTDKRLSLPYLIPDPLNLIVAIITISIGLLLVAWSGFAQLKIGKGTPVPKIPTQRLVTVEPYSLCRNPMLLGTVLYYFGISLWLNSVSVMALTVLFLLLSSAYVKLVEEKELENRFSEEYLEYKKKTPFLIPKFNEHVKDILILCIIGLIAIEWVSLILGFAISLTIFNSWSELKDFSFSSILDLFKRNPFFAGVGILFTHITIVVTRLSLILHYDKKYGIHWTDELSKMNVRGLLPIVIVVLFFEVVVYFAITGDYTPQITGEYKWFSKLGTGFVGYVMQFLYYVVEGIWIASVLEIGSKRWNYGGLIALLIFWTPGHLLRLNGISLLNFSWAIVTAIILELCRRRSGVVAVVLIWLLIIVL